MATDNLNINSNYSTFGEVYKKVIYVDNYSQDYRANIDRWRGVPLSDKNYIFPAIAGYKPYKTEHRSVVQPSPDYADNLKWYYPCSTLLPASKDYQTTKEIVMQP